MFPNAKRRCHDAFSPSIKKRKNQLLLFSSQYVFTCSFDCELLILERF